MGTAEAIVDDIDLRLGRRIHDLRTERGLTLDGLADAAGVSRAMLSRIERGESSPTAQLLNKVCDGLGTTLSALFAYAPAASPLARQRDQPTWRDPATCYLRRNVSPAGTGSPVDIVEVEFPAGARVAFDRQRSNKGDQQVWVLDGILQMHVGSEQFQLETGDCLAMRFDQPIVFHNPTKRGVRYAVVIHHGTSTR